MSNDLAKVDVPALLGGTVNVKSTASTPSQRDIEIWQLCESGLLATEVATHTGCTVATVKRACREVERFMASGVAIDVTSLKMQNHLRLDLIYKEFVAAWRDSSGKKVKKKRKSGPRGEEEEVTETEECGDPRFLMGAMKALADQREMWPGANAPKAQSITGPTGTEDPQINIKVDEMSDEQIDKISALIDELRESGMMPE